MSIKVERKLHDMRIWGRVLCAGGTCLAPTGVKRRCESTKYGTIREASFDLNIIYICKTTYDRV